MKENSQKKRSGLILKLVLIAIVSVFMTSILLTGLSAKELITTNKERVINQLKTGAVQLAGSASSMNDDGDWEMDGETLIKGGDVIEEELEGIMDAFHEKTGVDYTIFYGDTRILTTICKAGTKDRLVGTKASDAVIDAVLKKGEDFHSTDLNIEGQPYYGYYVPLKNNDNSVVGMCFTGYPSAKISKAITKTIMILIGLALIIVAIITVFGFSVNKKISKQMKGVSENLLDLSNGELSIEVLDDTINRPDELGEIGESTKELVNKIASIIGQTKTMANDLKESGTELARHSDQASQASNQVASAIDDISRGAISQAESIQEAVHDVESVGESVDSITDSTNRLQDASKQMNDNCNEAMSSLNMLIEQSEKVSESVKAISETIERTSKSSDEISSFTEAINQIATQTNLLSLNASIEAARAGDAGKGFAVVASEISNLAAQSKESAENINEIVTKLMSDAKESVSVMNELTESFNKQGEQLDVTKDCMENMTGGIGLVSDSSDEITAQVDGLKVTKENLSGIIEDLSAISEENAASAQETNASVEELSATFQVINENANNLQKSAEELDEAIGFFKLDNKKRELE